MSLLEKRKLPMQYSESLDHLEVAGRNGQDSQVEINLGKASAKEWKWWKALVHPGQGWRPGGNSKPPWTIAYRGNSKCVITAEIVDDDANPDKYKPPSSLQPVEPLAQFASAHRLVGQSSLALAMAMSLPLHNEMRSGIELPSSSSFTEPLFGSTSTSNIYWDFKNLPYYMLLSSNSQFLSSALWGIFWEQGIDFNLVVAWYEPIIRVISRLINRGKIKVLAHLFANQRPNTASVWYGVLGCGRTRVFHGIIDFLKTLRPPTLYTPMSEIAT